MIPAQFWIGKVEVFVSALIRPFVFFQKGINHIATWDFLLTVPLRIYLAAVFWIAGMNKIASFDETVEWFGNAEWGLGLTYPLIMAYLAIAAEVGGAILLLLGFATRWVTIPLMITMAVAAISVHFTNGWQAVHDPLSPWANAMVEGAQERLEVAEGILRQNGNYEWLTEYGNFAVVNNGIEWAVTYFLMLMALFVIGAGRYFSIDYWLKQKFMKS